MNAGAEAAPAKRYAAIDLLRGLTIGFMIMANNNGGDAAPWPFRHADWNGFTPTDLVFPTFLFIVGISAVFACDARIRRGESAVALMQHAFRRSAILILLGIVVNSFPFFALDTMRFYGVLQRIAVCYLTVTALYLAGLSWRAMLAIGVAALVAYWWLICFVPVPGFGYPGQDIALLDPDANLTAWLDRRIFSPPHLYEQTRDPEGLLSTVPALATALIGVLAGVWLRGDASASRKATMLAFIGAGCIVLGGLWDLGGFPINKKLWTSSYVLFAGGWSLLLLALFLVVADRPSCVVRGAQPAWRTALDVFGTNAIVAYMFSELLAATFGAIHMDIDRNLQQWLVAALGGLIPNPSCAALTYSAAFATVCWLAVYPLHRRRIFIHL